MSAEECLITTIDQLRTEIKRLEAEVLRVHQMSCQRCLLLEDELRGSKRDYASPLQDARPLPDYIRSKEVLDE